MQPSRLSITDLILHLHPRSLPAQTLRFTLSWGLGGMAGTLVGLIFVTGMLMLLVYQPAADQAYGSVLAMTGEVPFGRWVRNIHYLGANLLVVITLLHLLRVALTGGFGPGRRLNWVVGLALFFLVLMANFTGYLLPWDQLAYWAVTICANMLGYIPLCGAWLQEQANPGMSPNPTKAPWYFQGFQELLLHLHPTFAIFVWPLLGGVASVGLPFVRGSSLSPGSWFGSTRGRRLAVRTVLVGMAATAGAILLDNMLLLSSGAPAGDAWITRGLVPTTVLLALAAGAYALMTRRLRYSRGEAVMSLLLFAVAALTVCTVVGHWFRGPEMRLIWPWKTAA